MHPVYPLASFISGMQFHPILLDNLIAEIFFSVRAYPLLDGPIQQ